MDFASEAPGDMTKKEDEKGEPGCRVDAADESENDQSLMIASQSTWLSYKGLIIISTWIL